MDSRIFFFFMDSAIWLPTTVYCLIDVIKSELSDLLRIKASENSFSALWLTSYKKGEKVLKRLPVNSNIFFIGTYNSNIFNHQNMHHIFFPLFLPLLKGVKRCNTLGK